MPLLLQVHKQGDWRTVGVVRPGDRAGSLSHNGANGRQIYSFECRGDHSIVRRSVGGADTEVGSLRAILPLAGFKTVANLTARDQGLELMIKTDNMLVPQRFRFRHVAET